MFRRDENVWDYSLQANPLNPATHSPMRRLASIPLSARRLTGLTPGGAMGDYNLTLLPQSKIRFRLGYSRNVTKDQPSAVCTRGPRHFCCRTREIRSMPIAWEWISKFCPGPNQLRPVFNYYKGDTDSAMTRTRTSPSPMASGRLGFSSTLPRTSLVREPFSLRHGQSCVQWVSKLLP